ncbi:MAG: DMT family transporter [Methylocystis sp.]|nr:DMT family transporter [Methylocystis sp.]MCA3584252.1 DMT family transporter [Methylocystis sp.]MCA3589132.1 DMT family transporter [Methylocystis sp.]MCA3591423.1 DMT family transporter [Methylocystis sp.]
MNGRDWGRLVLLSLLWGGTFLFSAIAIKGWPAGAGNGLPPLTVVFLRVLVAAATLFLILKAMRIAIPADGRVWLAFFGMGLLNNAIPFSLIFWGQSQMPVSVAAGLASILNATTPLFTVLVAHLLTADEKATPLKIAGVLLGSLGVATMIGLDALSGASQSLPGYLACLGAALVYAFAGLFGRRFKRLGVLPLQAAFGQVAASSAIMLVIAAVIDQPWTLPAPGLVPLLATVTMGVVSTAFAYILYFQLLASAGATNLALVTFLIPVSSILLGIAVLGETLQLQHLLGMAFIAVGLAAIDGRLFRKRAVAA